MGVVWPHTQEWDGQYVDGCNIGLGDIQREVDRAAYFLNMEMDHVFRGSQKLWCSTEAIISMLGIVATWDVLIAERLSARQLIPRQISEIVCMYVCMYVYMYPSRLGIQLFRALRANVVSRAPV